MVTGTVKDVTVVHHNYGAYTAHAVRDKLGAVMEAAKAWGARWTVIATECRFEEAKHNGGQ